MSDQRFGARLLRLGIGRFRKPGFRRKPRGAVGQYHGMRGGKIGRQVGAGFHNQMESHSRPNSNDKLSAHARRTPGLMGISPIDAGLRRGDQGETSATNRMRLRRWGRTEGRT